MLPNQRGWLKMDNAIEGQTLTPIPREQGKSITMDFPDAIREIMNGKKVRRITWPEADYGVLKDGWLEIFTNNAFHVWKVSEADMIDAHDWIVVKEENARN